MLEKWVELEIAAARKKYDTELQKHKTEQNNAIEKLKQKHTQELQKTETN
jgi:hypothetical protein